MTLSITIHFIECHYADSHDLFIVILNAYYVECRKAECRYAECHGTLKVRGLGDNMTHLLSNYNCNFSSEQDNYGFFNFRKLGTLNNPTNIILCSFLFTFSVLPSVGS